MGVSLWELIQQVKDELLQIQDEEAGKPGMLRLEKIEMEVGVSLGDSGAGGLDLKIVNIGAEVSREETNIVRLSFSPISTSTHAIGISPWGDGRSLPGAFGRLIDEPDGPPLIERGGTVYREDAPPRADGSDRHPGSAR